MADEDDIEAEAREGQPDLSDPAVVQKQRRSLKREEQEMANELRKLLGTTAGRRLFARIVHDYCGLYRPVANAAFDAQALHFREGGRAVGLLLHELALQHAKPQYMVLMSETIGKPL